METTLHKPSRKVKIALAQFAMVDDPDANLTKAQQLIGEAAGRGAQIVCLPELFRSPYFCREERCARDYVEAVPGPVGKALADQAKELGISIVGGSIYEMAPDGRRFNTSMIIGADGELLETYRKVHIPHDPSFYEKNYFDPGDRGFKVIDIGIAKVGVLICYDQWFPEAARSVALGGADIIFYPTAIGTLEGVEQVEGKWQEAWEAVQRGHAVANNVIVATVNRVGKEGSSLFWGGSFVYDAFGTLLAHAGAGEEIIYATVDLEHSRSTREAWRFFASRRPDQYRSVAEEG